MNINLKSRSYTIYKEWILCIPIGHPAIYRININTFQVEFLCRLNNAFRSNSAIIIKNRNDFFGVNLLNGAIAKFDIVQKREVFLRVPAVSNRFVNAFFEDDKIILVPKFIKDSFLVFDIKKESFEKDNEWNNALKKAQISGFIRNAEIDKRGRVIFTIGNSNILCIYDKEKKLKKFSIGDSSIFLKCIIIAADKYYIIPSNKCYLIIFEPIQGDFRVINIKKPISGMYIREILIKNKLFLQTKEGVDVFDLQTEKLIYSLAMPPEFNCDMPGASLFLTGFFFRERYYLLPYGANLILEVSQNYICTGKSLQIKNLDIIKTNVCIQEAIWEKEVILGQFLKVLTTDNYTSVYNDKQKNNYYGKDIYKSIKYK